jgi:nitroreductase
VDLRDALRTTGSVREFTSDPVADEVVASILDDARFAPSGGNRQGWHVIVVRDAAVRSAIRDSYLDAWHEYVGHLLVGAVPFSPIASADERARAAAKKIDAVAHVGPDDFAARLDEVPVMLVVTVDLAVLAAVDRDLPRYTFCGGGSVYPFVWSLLLGARERGLGGVMTTVAIRHEDALRDALHLPDSHAVACVLALGYPVTTTSRLTRRAIAEFVTVDTFTGPQFRN